MTSRFIFPAILVIALLGLVGISYLNTVPKSDVIRQHILRATQLATYDQPLHPLESVAKAAELASFIHFPAQIESAEEEGIKLLIQDKRQAKQKILAGLQMLESLELNFEISKIHTSKDLARVEGIGSALGTIKSEGKFFDQHRLRLELVNNGGHWKFRSLLQLENLRESN